MTQFPSPYTPPSGYPYYGYGPDPQSLAPIRRASNLMIALGVLGLLLGICGGLFAKMDWSQLPADQRETLERQIKEIETTQGVPFRETVIIASITAGVVSLLLLGLGAAIRGRRRAAIMAAMILTGLILAGLGVELLAGLAGSARAQSGAGFAACFSMVALVPFALQMSWLVRGYRLVGPTSADDQQTQAQYLQYLQQQQQAYALWYAQQARQVAPPQPADSQQPPAQLPPPTPPQPQ